MRMFKRLVSSAATIVERRCTSDEASQLDFEHNEKHGRISHLKLLTAAMGLLMCAPVWSQTQPQTEPIADVVIDGIRYDRSTREVTVTFRNGAAHEVTGFGWLLTVHRAHSSDLIHREMVDLLPLISLRSAAVKILSTEHGLSFMPGETYELKWVPPPQWGPLATEQMTAKATVVIYDDSSAIGDAVVIEQIFKSRRGEISSELELVNKVRSVPRDADSTNHLRRLADASAALERTPGQRTTQPNAAELARVASIHEQAGWTAVDELLRAYEARAAVMTAQSQRREK